MSILTNSPWVRVPKSSGWVTVLLILCSCVTSTTFGYDGSMMNGLNILPSYTDYFSLTTATLALNSSSVWLGSTVAGVVYARVPDRIGRKPAMFYAALLTIFSVVIQAASQNIAMFVVARILIGLGTGASSVAAPVFLAETLPMKWRAWGLGIIYNFWYVGGLISAGVTYGTAGMNSTWAWRLPSALQGIFSIMCILILPFVPESPRWLAHRARYAECLTVVAQTYANGREDDPVVLVQYREIIDTIEFEKSRNRSAVKVVLKDMVFNPSSRKRIILAVSVAVFSMLSGNNIVSYYLGIMLTNAGITDTTTQLQINIILNGFCLVCSLGGTVLADYLGRKSIAAISTFLCTVFIFLVGAFTKLWGDSTDNHSGVYATVAMIFLFQGAYSIGWTPLSALYPPEVLSYSMRSLGMGIYTFAVNGVGLMTVWVFPFALEAIGWETYMINGSWDVIELAFVLWYWVETKGSTLEEIDEYLDGEVHSEVPKLGEVIAADVETRASIIEGIPRKASSATETVTTNELGMGGKTFA